MDIVYDAKDNKVGFINDVDKVFDSQGSEVGEVTKNGWVYSGKEVTGYVFSDGSIHTLNGKVIGEVSAKGTVQNEDGTPI